MREKASEFHHQHLIDCAYAFEKAGNIEKEISIKNIMRAEEARFKEKKLKLIFQPTTSSSLTSLLLHDPHDKDFLPEKQK